MNAEFDLLSTLFDFTMRRDDNDAAEIVEDMMLVVDSDKEALVISGCRTFELFCSTSAFGFATNGIFCRIFKNTLSENMKMTMQNLVENFRFVIRLNYFLELMVMALME